MDVLATIRKRIDELASTPSYTGLVAVSKHLEVADEHFDRASSGGGAHLYTDALLRCNRALMGLLREAHRLLEGDDLERHPFDIERHFRSGGGLGSPASERLENYLSTWRDPSLIDQQQVPGRQEAFLALLDLSALFSVVLDRIAEIQAYRLEKGRIANLPTNGSDGAPLAERLVHLLMAFASSLPEPGTPSSSEPRLQGRLRGFLETVMPGTALMVDPPLKSPSGTLKPNFILAEGDESVVLEIRSVASDRGESLVRDRRRVTEQMMMHLLTSGIANGIAVLLPASSTELAVEDATVRLDGRVHTIATLLPPRDGGAGSGALATRRTGSGAA